MSEAHVQRWQAPPVAGGPVSASGADGRQALTAQRLAEIEALARSQGLQQGRAEGLRQGRQEGLAQCRQQAERLAGLLDTLAAQSDVLDDALVAQLAQLVAAGVRHFVRRELQLQPGEVIRVVRECLATLPASDARVRVRLNPEDAALVREALNVEQFERAWVIVEDPTLQRGGSRLDTDVSSVDASLETRLNALISRLLGDARRHDDAG